MIGGKLGSRPQLPSLTSAIGDDRRPIQPAHLVTPCSPQPRISHDMEFCAGTGMQDPSVLLLTVAKQVYIDTATVGQVVWTGEPARSSDK